MLPAQPNQSLIDGLACLHTVIAAGAAVGSREVGRRCRLERTRANRLLGTWRHLGLLDQTPSAKYVPGPGVHVLAGMGLRASGLLQAALPALQRWWQEGWATSLVVRWQDRACFLVHSRPGQDFAEGIGSHATAPAWRSSAGLVLLAEADDADLETWACAEGWQTQGDGRTFAEVITEVRGRGHATRTYPGDVRSIGIAVPGTRAAIAVSRAGLTARALTAAVTDVRADAAAIAARVADDHAALVVEDDADALPA